MAQSNDVMVGRKDMACSVFSVFFFFNSNCSVWSLSLLKWKRMEKKSYAGEISGWEVS